MKFDKIYVFLSTVLLFTILSWVSSCRHDTILPSDLPTICFKTEVLPVFANNCGIAGCHDGLGEPGSDYNSYPDIIMGVVPGKPNSSNIYKAIMGIKQDASFKSTYT
jgi:hypothetical protein